MPSLQVPGASLRAAWSTDDARHGALWQRLSPQDQPKGGQAEHPLPAGQGRAGAPDPGESTGHATLDLQGEAGEEGG